MGKLRVIVLPYILLVVCMFFNPLMMIELADDSVNDRTIINSTFLSDFKSSLMNQREDKAIAANLSVLMHVEAQKLLARSYNTEITQQDIINQINAIARAEGGDNALSFPTLVYSGDDFQSLHGNPYDDEIHAIDPIVEPIVMIDLGAQYNGMCSDVTRTYFFENASEEMKQAYQVVVDAELAVIEAIKPGVRVGYLNDIFYEVYNQSGFTMEGAYIHPNWGHGVNYYVHQMPVLGHPEWENYTLMVGETLAIEPSYFSLENGWSVRVEDTIEVTSSGNIILSDSLPRQLNDVTILPISDNLELEINLMDYSYHKRASITVSSGEFPEVQSMEFYDGYKWRLMDKIDSTSYNASYYVDRTYSTELLGLVKITSPSGKTVYFSKELHLIPQGTTTKYSFDEILVRSDNYENTTYGGKYDLTTKEWEPNNKYTWIFLASETDMIRIHFKSASFNQDDSFMLLDENDYFIKEYFVFQNTSSTMDAFWSPWISGSVAKLRLEALSQFGFREFSFTIDQVEIISLEIPTTSESGPTTTTSSNANALGVIGGLGILYLIIRRRKRTSNIFTNFFH